MMTTDGHTPRNHRGFPYQGKNYLILLVQSLINGYSNENWCTYGRALIYGMHVRRGEKGTLINAPNGNKFYVYNYDQMDY